MRIVFMGTPDFAVPCLEALADGGYDLAAVYTQPDKPKGRGYAMTPPPVKEFALSRDIPVFQPERVRDEAEISRLRNLNPDCIVVVAYGRILPQEILDIPPLGCVNIHGSLLPKYRGAAPVQWAVLNGDSVTGVTSMKMDAGMDTGEILLAAETTIGEEETAGELFDRLKAMSGPLLLKTLQGLEDGTLTPIKQEEKNATLAPMLTKELSPINWSRSAREIHNQIRGLNPWPGAHTQLRGKRLKVYASRVLPERTEAAFGTVVDTKRLAVACGDGAVLQLTAVQLEGKRRMAAQELLRGFPLETGARLL